MSAHGFLRWLSITACWLISPALLAQDLRDGFAAQVDGQILAMAIEADGRVLIGGDFTRINDFSCRALCRLNVDGTVANPFGIQTVGQVVTALAVQPDGRIVYANAYTAEDFGIQRRFANGARDPSLDVALGSMANALAIEPDGDILVGGGPFLDGGVETTSMLRLRSDGSIDTAFTPRFGTTGAIVRAIALRDDGGIYIGGRFGAINNDSRINLALFTPDGTLDDTLDRAVNGPVNALAVQADGKLLIGGAFTQVINSQRSNLARLRTDTLIDPGFAPAINGEVRAIEVLADGSIGIGGRFNLIGTAQRTGLARLSRDGALLPSPRVDALASGAQVNVLREQADRRLLFGGRFNVGGPQQNTNLARADIDGRLDQDLIPPASSGTTAVLQQPDGRLLVARSDGCSGGTRLCLQRLFSDGSVDASFAAPGFNAGIRELALLPDGDILVAGDFTEIDGIARPNLVRLNPNGSLDGGFAMPAELRVAGFARFADGRIAAGGVLGASGPDEQHVLRFLLANGSFDAAAETPGFPTQGVQGIAIDGEERVLVALFQRNVGASTGAARFFADGRRDDSFSLTSNGRIRAVHALPDGRLLLGGSFSNLRGQSVRALARLRADGSLDTGFSAALDLPNGTPSQQIGVNAMSVRRDGRIVVGLTAGATNLVQSSLRLLEPNGAAISAIAPSLLGVVDTLYLQDDGRILFGGRFTTRFGLTRVGLARLALPGAGGSRLDVADDTAVLRHGPAAPELLAPPRLSASLDGNAFLFDAPFVRSAEGWRLDALGLPQGVSFFLRVRTAPGQGVAGAAQGLTQHVFIQPPDLRLFQNGFEAP